MGIKLTKRQEKQLYKVFDDPKKLRKWVDQVYDDIILKCQDKTEKTMAQYLDIYSIAVAYTLRYVCGFGKKRLPEVMQRIWNNVDSFKTGHLKIQDCIHELKENGIDFDTITKDDKILKEFDEEDYEEEEETW